MAEPPRFSEPDLSQLGIDPVPLPAGGDAQGGTGALTADAHDRLMALPGVVMVGEGQDETGGQAIIVGVKRSDQLRHVPTAIGGVKVVAQVIGEVDALPAGRPG